MLQPTLDLVREQIISVMIDLTRASIFQRIIITGSDSANIDLDLRRRGFFRVATTATCIPRRQHNVGFVSGLHLLHALETALSEVSHFLSATAAIAVAIETRERGFSLKVRDRLEQVGFRIEAGVGYHERLILSERRRDFSHMTKAA